MLFYSIKPPETKVQTEEWPNINIYIGELGGRAWDKGWKWSIHRSWRNGNPYEGCGWSFVTRASEGLCITYKIWRPVTIESRWCILCGKYGSEKIFPSFDRTAASSNIFMSICHTVSAISPESHCHESNWRSSHLYASRWILYPTSVQVHNSTVDSQIIWLDQKLAGLQYCHRKAIPIHVIDVPQDFG